MAKRKAAPAPAKQRNASREDRAGTTLGETPEAHDDGAPSGRSRSAPARRPAGQPRESRAARRRRRAAGRQEAAKPRRDAQGGRSASARRSAAAEAPRTAAAGSTASAGRSTKRSRRRPRRSTWTGTGRPRAPAAPRWPRAAPDHASMTPAITGGDVDVNVENAYFSGDEAPGGDNPTPDQDVVDDIGKALGVEYQDNEELRAQRQGRRARQAPLGARSGLLGRLQGQKDSGSRNWKLEVLKSAIRVSVLTSQFSVFSITRITSSTTSSTDFPVVSIDDGVGGGIERRRGARAIESVALGQQRRDVGDRGRAAGVRRIAARGAGRAPRPTHRGRSSRRRRGNTTVPMSRPSITMPPPAPSSRCRATRTARTLRQPRHRRRGAIDLRRPDLARHVVAVDRHARAGRSRSRDRSAMPRHRRLRRRAARRRAAPSSRPRDTSRRCRRAGSPARAAIARATVPLPAPDGPSMAMISVRMSRRSLAWHRDRQCIEITKTCRNCRILSCLRVLVTS